MNEAMRQTRFAHHQLLFDSSMVLFRKSRKLQQVAGGTCILHRMLARWIQPKNVYDVKNNYTASEFGVLFAAFHLPDELLLLHLCAPG